jgi:hypothetical protein
MAAEIHVGDVGLAFQIDVVDETGTIVDISSATLMEIRFALPDGSVVVQTASLVTDGKDGQMHYVTLDGDLSQSGNWKMQGYVELNPSQKLYTDITKFKVFANI